MCIDIVDIWFGIANGQIYLPFNLKLWGIFVSEGANFNEVSSFIFCEK